MLAGLIFATHDADDRADALAATLPFGGATLIEYQARLLIDAGASQILVAVARVTPELLGAVNRIARRGAAVDVVRSAVEASAKVHPLARIVVLADALVTTETVLSPAIGEGGDLLVVTETSDDEEFERIDATTFWAGIARIGAARLVEAAALPRDYDFQSTLLRVTNQAGATRLMLPVGNGRAGHGVERDSGALTRRGRAVFAAIAANRPAWIDRWLFAPVARLVLPPLVARGGSAGLLLAAGTVLAAGAVAGVWAGWSAAGLAAVMFAIAAATIGSMLAWLRGEDALVRGTERGTALVAALALVAAAAVENAARGTATAAVLATAAIVAAVLVDRLRAKAGWARWWGSPAAYPLLLLPFAAAGQMLVGLGAVAGYAALTLAGAVERVRKQP